MAKKKAVKKEEGAKNPYRVMLGSAGIPVRLSYPHLAEPSAFEEGDDAKYSATFLIDKEDEGTVKRIKRAIRACYDDNKTATLGDLPITSKKLWNPLRDGEDWLEEHPEASEYEDCMFVRASSKSPVVCFDEDGEEIIDIARELYAGCNVRAELRIFAFNQKGNKGFGFFLNSVKKVDDEGERIGGVLASHDAYDDEDDEDDDDII